MPNIRFYMILNHYFVLFFKFQQGKDACFAFLRYHIDVQEGESNDTYSDEDAHRFVPTRFYQTFKSLRKRRRISSSLRGIFSRPPLEKIKPSSGGRKPREMNGSGTKPIYFNKDGRRSIISEDVDSCCIGDTEHAAECKEPSPHLIHRFSTM